MNELIACCGLDCEKCDARIATIENNYELREKTAKKWNALNGISSIKAADINCTGCRVDGAKIVFCGDMCEIRKCVSKKGYSTCGDCVELNVCPIVGAIFKHSPNAKENLKA